MIFVIRACEAIACSLSLSGFTRQSSFLRQELDPRVRPAGDTEVVEPFSLQSVASAAFSVVLGRIAADAFAGSGR